MPGAGRCHRLPGGSGLSTPGLMPAALRPAAPGKSSATALYSVLYGRHGQQYCSRDHKRSALRARRRREGRSNSLPSRATLSESRAADARFHAAIAADTASRAPRERPEWLAYERRHGTEHPARTADRIARQAAERAARAPRFRVPTLAERGRAERNRAPVFGNPGTPWDDTDPETMEPAQMLDLGNWRRGWRF